MRTAKPAAAPAPSTHAKTAACAFETLARSPALHVQRCRHCNTLSLHVGAVTLRFDAASAEAVWGTLGEALIALHGLRQREEGDELVPPPRSGRGSGKSERNGVN